MNRITLERIDVKRDSRQLAVFLLLGATINIAVAWSCAFWAAPANTLEGWGSEVTRPNLVDAWVGQPEGFPGPPESGMIYPRRAGVQKSTMLALHDGVDYDDIPAFVAAPMFDLELVESGWPFASFVGGLWFVNFELQGPTTALLVDPGEPGYNNWTIIPLMPKWPGFLANTIFFGGIVFLLFRWPRALRRHLRAKAGLCSATLACG